jgi:hypothetical protein
MRTYRRQREQFLADNSELVQQRESFQVRRPLGFRPGSLCRIRSRSSQIFVTGLLTSAPNVVRRVSLPAVEYAMFAATGEFLKSITQSIDAPPSSTLGTGAILNFSPFPEFSAVTVPLPLTWYSGDQTPLYKYSTARIVVPSCTPSSSWTGLATPIPLTRMTPWNWTVTPLRTSL